MPKLWKHKITARDCDQGGFRADCQTFGGVFCRQGCLISARMLPAHIRAQTKVSYFRELQEHLASSFSIPARQILESPRIIIFMDFSRTIFNLNERCNISNFPLLSSCSKKRKKKYKAVAHWRKSSYITTQCFSQCKSSTFNASAQAPDCFPTPDIAY